MWANAQAPFAVRTDVARLIGVDKTLLLIVGGPLAVVVFVPGLWLDRVIFNNDGFYSRHGFWFSPVTHIHAMSCMKMSR